MTTCGIRLLSTAGRTPAPYLPLSHTLATTFENGQSSQSAADSAVAASSRLADICVRLVCAQLPVYPVLFVSKGYDVQRTILRHVSVREYGRYDKEREKHISGGNFSLLHLLICLAYLPNCLIISFLFLCYAVR